MSMTLTYEVSYKEIIKIKYESSKLKKSIAFCLIPKKLRKKI